MTRTHIFICGLTQVSGKTTLAAYLFRRWTGLSTFFNTQHNHRVQLCSDIVVSNIKDYAEVFEKAVNEYFKQPSQFEKKALRVCFNPDLKESVAAVQLKQIVNLNIKFGKILHKKRMEVVQWGNIIVDEAHRFSKKTDPSESVDVVFTGGLGLGLRGMAISQRPAMVSHTILGECLTHYIFLINAFDSPYFKRYKLEIGDNNSWLQKPYHFLKYSELHPDLIKKMKPIPDPEEWTPRK